MLLSELFEDWEDRFAYQQHITSTEKQMYGLKNKEGKIIRKQLSIDAAKALSSRSDLINTYGKLFVVKL